MKGALAVMESVSRDRNGIPALDEARTAVERLAEDMGKIKETAKLGIRHHATGPGYVEEIEQLATAALAAFKGDSNVSSPKGDIMSSYDGLCPCCGDTECSNPNYEENIMKPKSPPIKMPATMLAAWLAALRSGKYEQGASRLQTVDGKYCCLGVLQHIVDGDVERWPVKNDSKAMISQEWCRKHLVEASTPALSVLACMNDGDDKEGVRSHSFVEIADYIETCVVGV